MLTTVAILLSMPSFLPFTHVLDMFIENIRVVRDNVIEINFAMNYAYIRRIPPMVDIT